MGEGSNPSQVRRKVTIRQILSDVEIPLAEVQQPTPYAMCAQPLMKPCGSELMTSACAVELRTVGRHLGLEPVEHLVREPPELLVVFSMKGALRRGVPPRPP